MTNKTKTNLFVKIFIRLIGIVILSSAIFSLSGFLYYLKTSPELNVDSFFTETTSYIYDTNNKVIAELGVEKRKWVNYEDISPNMINAIIAIEDQKYFEHNGVDILRFFGALVHNLKTKSYSQGGSTITQQLIKNTHFSNEKTIKRKIQEMKLAIELEKELDKEKIMELYLNRILFSGRIYGVEKASEYFFDKPASALTISESALLAGMIQKPNIYNPYTNPEQAIQRRNIVLNRMIEAGLITESEGVMAKNTPLEDILIDYETLPNDFEEINSFLDYVIYEAKNKYGIDPLTESVIIYTTLDMNSQKHLNNIINNEINFPDDDVQVGSVIIDNYSGEIKALYGGRNLEVSLPFNFATDARRQPGSTIKPILDYAPAIEYLHWSTGQPILDEKIFYKSSSSAYLPVVNWDNRYKGWVTLREALIESRNVPAVKAFNSVDNEKKVNLARSMGLNIGDNLHEAHALGGFDVGFSVLEMTSAYSVFANEGLYIEPYSIKKIVNNNEVTEAEVQDSFSISKETAYMITDILHDNMEYGTGKKYNIDSMYLAGKTGQSNYNESVCEKFDFPTRAVRDSWFIGYSKNYTIGVWSGYPILTEGAYLDNTTKHIPKKIWNLTMNKVNPHSYEEFEKPQNIIEVEVETHTQDVNLSSKYTPYYYKSKELFIKGYEPKYISNNWKPLIVPTGLDIEYDLYNEILQVNINSIYDNISDEQIRMSQIIAELEDKYNYYRRKIIRDANSNSISSSTLGDPFIYSKIKKYSTKNNLCIKYLNNILLSKNQLLSIINYIEEKEINSINGKNYSLLSEAEISNLVGWEDWRGFHDGVQSTLGKYQYILYGNKNGKLFEINRTYNSNYELQMEFDEFISIDAFFVEVDYSKYSNRLNSKLSDPIQAKIIVGDSVIDFNN